MITDTCQHLDTCGGCPSFKVMQSEQLEKKRRWIEGMFGVAVDEIVPSPRALGYRSRVSMKVSDTGELCYTKRGTNELFPVSNCLVARPEIQSVIERLPSLNSEVTGVEFRSNGEQVNLAFTTRKGRSKVAKASLRAIDFNSLGVTGVSVDGKRIHGPKTMRLISGGVEHQVSGSGFYQVNLEINELLIERIKSYVLSLEPTKLLDLFSGAGNLSLPLAKEGVDCVLWESNPNSVKDGNETIERLGLETELTKRNAFRFEPGDEFFDVALLDPPRGGAKGLLASLTVTRPKAIIYVACSPVSFARDLKEAVAAGYRVTRLTILDMFPQTEQCELLAFLEPA